MDKVRVGVIGCGVGRSHVAAYSKMPNVEVVALAGLDEDRCSAMQKEFNIERRYRDYEDLIAQPDIEAVSVCVPNFLHAPVAQAALQAGKHVLVEKPLAIDVAAGETMVKTARETGKKLMIVFNYRQRGDARHLKKFITSGGTGPIYYGRAGWLRRHGIPGIGSWFTQKAQSGGGPLIDLGVHILDLSLWLMGSPQPLAVSASTYARFGPRGLGNWPGTYFPPRSSHYDVEDLAVAFIRLAGGATLHLEASWAAYTSAQDDYFVHLMGDEGGAELNVKNYTQVDTLRFYTRAAGAYAEIKPEYLELPGHGGVMQDFIDAILLDKPVSPSGEDGLTILRIIDAIYRSAAAGHEVEIVSSSQ